MKKQNWDAIEEARDFDFPKPDGYIAVICNVEDYEDKEYLSIEWDFADGPYHGANGDTYDRAGFWPTKLLRSYKPKALGFFKAFKTCLEVSNPRYVFREDRLDDMVGKRLGVVLGEEEYRKNDGGTGTRLYVAQVRSVKAIQEGDFKIPALKKLPAGAAAPVPVDYGLSSGGGQFADLGEAENDLPF